MSNIEQNKKAITDVFAIEDAKAVCEAIGGLGVDTSNEPTDDPLEYTPDNILDVVVNDQPDGMPSFPNVGQSEMDDETKAFVVDQMVEQLKADGRETVNLDDLIPAAVVIKGENHIPQDVVSFIDELVSGSESRLSTQNVSEAQPSGVAVDLTNSEGAAEPAAPAADDNAVLPPAPGGVPDEAPALDANPDEGMGVGATGDEFKLDLGEPEGEVQPEEGGDDSFTLDIDGENEAPAEAGADTVGELDFGDDAGEEGSAEGESGESSEEDDLFKALDGMSDEALDDGKEEGEEGEKSEEAGEGEGAESEEAEEKPAETECAEAPVATECGEVEPKMEDGEMPATEEVAAAAEELAPATECGAVEPKMEDGEMPATEEVAAAVDELAPATECGAVEPKMEDGEEDANLDAQLESIKDKYVENVARARVRAVVESYQKQRELDKRTALCESIIAEYRANEAKKEEKKAQMESTMQEKLSELGNKLVSEYQKKAEAKMEANESKLDAKLESIVSNFSKKAEEKKSIDALSAKLESIVAKIDAKKPEAVMESATAPADKEAQKKDALDAKLESIIANAKKKMAEAKA